MIWHHLGDKKYGVSAECMEDQTWTLCTDSIGLGFRPVWFLALFQILELLFVAVYALDVYFLFRVAGKDYWIRSMWNKMQIAVAGIITINTIICLLSIAVSGGTRVMVPQLSRCLRPWLIVYKLKNARRILSSLFNSVPKILNIAVILLLQLTIFSVLATLLFAGVSGARAGECEFALGPRDQTTSWADYCSTYSRNCTGSCTHVWHWR